MKTLKKVLFFFRYVHHLTTDLKEMIHELELEIPLLSNHYHSQCAEPQPWHDEVHEEVCQSYQDQITCATCHSDIVH